MDKDLEKIIEIAIEKKASDIHLTKDINPILRIDGTLTKLEDFEKHTSEKLNSYIKSLLNEDEIKKYKKEKALDNSFQYKSSRFRNHVYRQMKCDTVALRLIPTDIPDYEEINLPKSLKKFTKVSNGLILVVGVTGSGKSTTLASIISDINANQNKHIITVENPIEFIHTHKKSIINQREVGVDVPSFSSAVKDAMREDPDILLVGELRDLDTIMNAITMAETGHLVLGTLHTRSVPETIDRLVDVFPANQQEQIRLQLSNSIQGIVSQQLLKKTGGGRVPSCEIMFATDAIRSLIRNKANPNNIIDQMLMDSVKLGSQTRVQSVARLLKRGLITRKLAEETVGEDEVENLNGLLVAIDRTNSNERSHKNKRRRR